MLILSRNEGEEIVIFPGTPQEVRVMVVTVHAHRVRLGVTAPKNVAVHRSEVWRDIQAGKPKANGGKNATA